MTPYHDDEYLYLLDKVLMSGVYREGRNGATYGLFGEQLRFDISDSFPLLTTKFVHFHSVVVELCWLIHGYTNVQYLHDHNVSIWDEWAGEDGELGPVYGKQWRRWEGHEGHIDQLANVIDGLKKDPYGRRHIITAWNPADLDKMALPPCHTLFQFFVADGKLSTNLYMRSSDIFLGLPFNIASYALLTYLVAAEVGLRPGDLIVSLGDVHLYANHREQAHIQLCRDSLPPPFVHLEPGLSIFDVDPSDITLLNYQYHPAIKAPVSA